MKNRYFLILAFFTLFVFFGCQDESTEVNTPNEQEVIIPNSSLVTFINAVTSHNGAYDDILDDSDCFSIELPVTIIVSDITFVIETEDDLEQLEELLEDFDDDEDILDFVFPITIIFSDYTEVIIQNEDQLENFIEACVDEEDDVIECVDFVYPISFSVFNSDFNIVDNIVIENDEALYNFLEGLEDDDAALVVSLNYPVSLEYANGETIDVNSNEELADAIEAAEQDCENDEEDGIFDCFGDFELVECIGPNLEAEFNLSADTIGLIDCQYSFTPSFHITEADAEANINAIAETESYWSTTGQVYLRIEAESGNFEIFTIYLNTEECDYFECFGNYDLTACDENDGVEDGFAEFVLETIFANCPNDDVEYYFYISQADAEAEVNPLTSPFTSSLASVIYSRVVLAGDSNVYEIFTHQLIVEDCSENCSEEDIDAILIECLWNAVNYNGSDNLMEWNFDFEANSQIVVIYTDTQTIDATWTTSQSNDGVIITFSNVAGPNIQAITGEWLVVECEDNRLELHRGDDLLVLEQNCD